MNGVRLLVAEDEKNLQRVYLDAFGEDYEVLQAFDGVDALMLAVDKVPEVMLLDIAMPLLDGRSVCSKLKSFPRTRDIKIVMVTGRGDEYGRQVGFEVGADDYIDKPVDLQRLRRKVRSLCSPPEGDAG